MKNKNIRHLIFSFPLTTIGCFSPLVFYQSNNPNVPPTTIEETNDNIFTPNDNPTVLVNASDIFSSNVTPTGQLILSYDENSQEATIQAVSSDSGFSLQNATLLPTVIINDKTYKIVAMHDDLFGRLTTISGSITFSSAITTIGARVFESCTNISSFIFSSSLVTIGDSAFADEPNLESVDLSTASNLTTISSLAFSKDTKLSSINFNSAQTIQVIDEKAFQNCSNLTSVTLPLILKNNLNIKNGAFTNCSNLNTISFPQNYVLSFGTDPTSTSLTSIFAGCNSISHLNFYSTSPSTTMTNAQMAFSEINLGDEVHKINTYVPKTCVDDYRGVFGDFGKKCKFVNFEEGILPANEVFENNDAVGNVTLTFDNINQTAQITSSTGVNVTNPVFKTDVIYKDYTYTLTEIDDKAFENCTNLSGSLTFHNSITKIGDSTFSNCANLTKLTFDCYNNQGINSIGQNAFSGCSLDADALILPHTLYKISSFAFSDTQISQIDFNWSTFDANYILSNAFTDSKEIATINAKNGISYQIQNNAAYWGIPTENVNYYDTVDSSYINNYIQGATGTLGLSYDSDHKAIINKNTSITGNNLVVTDQISEIQTDAFANSSISGNLTFNNQNIKIDANIFGTNTNDFVNIDNIHLTYTSESQLSNVANRAFANAITKSFTLDCYENINWDVFYDYLVQWGIHNIQTVQFLIETDANNFLTSDNPITGKIICSLNPDSTYNIMSCSSDFAANDITINDNVFAIESEAFSNMKNLTGNITLNNNINRVEANAFNGCQLSYITLNWSNISQKEIKTNAFNKMTNLQYIYIPDSSFDEYNDDLLNQWGVSRLTFLSFTTNADDCFKLSPVTGDIEIGYRNKLFKLVSGNITGDDVTMNIVFNDHQITEICDNAFNYDSHLKEKVYFDESINTIGSSIFNNCSSISDIIINNPNFLKNSINDDWLNGISKHIYLHVNQDQTNDYKNKCQQWNINTNQIVPSTNTINWDKIKLDVEIIMVSVLGGIGIIYLLICIGILVHRKRLQKWTS